MAEALGRILGVLPLLVSAVEHYETVFRPFQRFKNFTPELARSQGRLLTQKTIFRLQCYELLLLATDEETANSMLCERKHDMWGSDKLESKIYGCLGQSAGAYIATMTDIEEQLKCIEQRAAEFKVVLDEIPVSASIFEPHTSPRPKIPGWIDIQRVEAKSNQEEA
jgi:hypothetical protein